MRPDMNDHRKYLKQKCLSSFLALCIYIPESALAIGQTVMDATKDSYIHSGFEDTNFGTETEIQIKKSNSGNLDREAYYHFDLSGLTSAVRSAYFRVGIEDASGAELRVSTTSTNWSENTLDWDNRITSSNHLIDIPAVEGSYIKIDVADIINSHISANQDRFTLIISANDITDSTLKLASVENNTSHKRPRLYIDPANNNDPFTFGISYTTTEKGVYTGHNLKTVSGSAQLSEYGGWTGWNLGATGYFRTEEVNGSWIMVDPLGYAFINVGLNSVVPGGGFDLPNDIKSFGINVMGSWSDESISNMPYTPRWNIMLGFKNTTTELSNLYASDILPVFEDNFESYVDERAKDIAEYTTDSYVLGHFSDNELPFHKNQLSLSLGLDNDNAQFIEANAWMQNKYGNNYDLSDITTPDEDAYKGHVVETYYRIVSEAIKRYDPNHLFLGTRIHSSGKYNEDILAAAGKYTDVISINYYGAWEPDNSTTNTWNDVGEKPILITEFYTKAEDSDLPNTDGAGWLVETQQNRSDFFENFALKLLGCKSCVGWHWFRYIDNNDSNKGVLSENYDAYSTLQNSMAQIAQNIYPLRSQLLYGNLDFNGAADNTPDNNATGSSTIVSMRKSNATGFGIDGDNHGENGQNVYLWSFDTNNINQQWEEIDRGDGYYTYQKRNTTFSLDGGNGGANGQTVYLWTTMENNYNQHWKKVDTGNGTFRLEKRNAPSFSIDGGTGGALRQDVYLWTSSQTNKNQQWHFE